MTPFDLASVLALHRRWLCGYPGGVRANLGDADLRDANVSARWLGLGSGDTLLEAITEAVRDYREFVAARLAAEAVRS